MKTFLKKNRGLLLLPWLLLPFVVILFYILGGGKDAGQNRYKQNAGQQIGANFELPDADQSIEIADKMEAYQQQLPMQNVTVDYLIPGDHAWTDSLATSPLTPENAGAESQPVTENNLNAGVSHNLLDHIRKKETEIKKELSEPDPVIQSATADTKDKSQFSQQNVSGTTVGKYPSGTPVPSSSVPSFHQRTAIDALDKVFDENLVLTARNDSLKFHLEQARRRLEELEKQPVEITLEKQTFSGFGKEQPEINLIKAEIYETTTVLDGNRVKLRLLEDTWLDGKKIVRNSFIYGICKINNERLHISITRFPVEEDFVPVDLAIHDLDGLPGLYVPGNAARKVTQEVGSSTNTSSLFGFTNDPLTYAGVRAADRTAQTLLKRVRLKRVTVKKNTLVYLVNNNQKQK